MKYGFVMPFGDARTVADAARAAERAGWDAIFAWEPVWGNDAWICLTAAAMVTERIRLGTMLTPLSRMRPWKLASETATLDVLSGGRVILAVGLGAPDSGFAAFGEQTDRRVRAELLDEGLAILTGLWAGEPLTFQGKHYRVDTLSHRVAGPQPLPVQRPRIPIWVVGAHGRPASMRRAAAYDGLLPTVIGADGGHTLSPERLPAILDEVRALRGDTGGYEIIVESEPPNDDRAAAAAKARAWAAAGATWWLESLWELPQEPGQLPSVLRRIAEGPPRG
jgi:alkanesulfonate monooxygenase SsuD/methylene tetrahydromethanopterin reductase-like flavin-dependent oxidoreductase (luciferase family)